MRAQTPPCMQKQRKVSEFNGALEEGSRNSNASTNKLRVKTAQMSQNSTGRWKKGPEVQNASAYRSRSFVVKDVAIDEVGRSGAGNVGSAALHAKVCNRSRNVPAGRWKKGLEGSNASTDVALRVKTAQVSAVQRGDGRRLQKFKCEHQRSACKNSASVSEFSGALEEGSRGFKCEHQPPAGQNSASVSEFSGAMERYAV